MAQTVDQVFQSKKLWAWYSSTVTNPFDGASEKGMDFGKRYGEPVAVPVGGQVVRIVHNNSSVNDVVELQASDGSVWLYQHITAKVKVGDVLGCGGVVGTENGLPAGDGYSTGTHIEVRYCPPGKWSASTDSWDEPWINPASVFASVGSQIAGTVSRSSFFQGALDAVSGSGKISIGPNADVTNVLVSIDASFAITNPFAVTVPTFSLMGAQVPDPVGYTQDVLDEIWNDMAALTGRLILAAMGVYILFKVSENFIDYGAVGQTALSAARTGAMFS